jgi:hypothetical protein
MPWCSPCPQRWHTQAAATCSRAMQLCRSMQWICGKMLQRQLSRMGQSLAQGAMLPRRSVAQCLKQRWQPMERR